MTSVPGPLGGGRVGPGAELVSLLAEAFSHSSPCPRELLLAPATLEQLTCMPGSREWSSLYPGQQTALQGYGMRSAGAGSPCLLVWGWLLSSEPTGCSQDCPAGEACHHPRRPGISPLGEMRCVGLLASWAPVPGLCLAVLGSPAWAFDRCLPALVGAPLTLHMPSCVSLGVLRSRSSASSETAPQA